MTLKDKLPDRLKCSPLLTMESDSDIETIAESIVNLSDSDGDFFKKTEKLLLMACLGYLRDWCKPSQRTMNSPMACLNLVLATAVFQTEYIIHDAILAVGHKPDETDGLILSIGAQVDDETVKSLPLAS